ncbi:hypothetical protein D3C80_1129750 [compost metagenome]
MAVRVLGQAFEGRIQAAEVEALRAVGLPKMLLQGEAPAGGLALLANPVLQVRFTAELQQRRTVAWHVQHSQVAGGVVQVQQVGGCVAVDVQRAQPQRVATGHQPGGLPCQPSCRLAEAAFTDLLVAGRDEVELAGQPVAGQVVAPVAVQLGFEGCVEVQLFDEALQGFGSYRQVGRGVIALWRGAAEQPVEHLIGGAVMVEARCRQGFDQPYRAIGQGTGPRCTKQGTEQVVIGLSLPVGQHRLRQAHALGNGGEIAAGAVGAVVQGDDVDLLRGEVMALLCQPLPDCPAGFAVRAGHMAEMIADVLHAGSVDAACGHGVHLAH